MKIEDYNIARIAYDAAISFTDIDSDKTTKEFGEWLENNHKIIIPDEYWISVINNFPYEEANKQL